MKPKVEVDVKQNVTVVTCKSETIRSLEDALKEAKVDLKQWEVERHVINKWDVGAKVGRRELAVTELWQVKVWLKRIVTDPIVSALERIANRKIGKIKAIKRECLAERHLLEVSLFDAHFGKLAWGPETGNDYNLSVAKTLYLHAAEDLLSRVRGYGVEQVLFPIGNDFFHMNNFKNTTEKGTQLETDTRMSKVFEAGCEAIIHCINRFLEVAPVNVIWVPGNHDHETSWYLAKFMEAWYRNIPEVRVNKDPQTRKYVGYGTNLLGFTHGDEEPHNVLPTLMATERPDLWAKATTRVWHIGHFHKKKETQFLAGDTFNGVSVQVLPSLSGADSWHYRKGYVKGHRAAEAYLWNYDEGYVGHFSAGVRK